MKQVQAAFARFGQQQSSLHFGFQAV